MAIIQDHPRIATPTQLSLHLSILSPQERHLQETCLEHQCSVWLSHIMASCKTQVYSKTGSSDLDIRKVSKSARTLDHHPRLRVQNKSQIWTNQDAQSNDGGLTYPLLCSSSPGKQYSGTFPHPFTECHRCIHQMVEWQTCSSSNGTSGPMVPHSKPPTTPQTVPAKVTSPSSRISSPMPHTIFQDGLHQTCSRPGPTLQSQTGHHWLIHLTTCNMLLQKLGTFQGRGSLFFPSIAS